MKDKMIIGRYMPANTIVHQLDPRAKLLFVFIFIIYIFLSHSIATYTFIFAIIYLCMRIANVKLWFLVKGLTPIFIFLVFTFLLHVFLTKGGTRLFTFGFITIDSNGIVEGIYIVLRLMFITMISTVMLLVTSPITLTDAIEKILAPLKYLKVPVHQLSMMMSVALRFIPTLMEELDKIILAQKSRGSYFGTGNVIQRIKSFIPLFIPLFISAFQRAEDLAIAMEVRGYNGESERTSYRSLQWMKRDTIAILLLIPIGMMIFILRYLGV